MKVLRNTLFATLLLVAQGALGMDSITAESAIVVESGTGRVLWERDSASRRYPASTTKIMTALLLIENVRMDAVLRAPADVESVKGSSLDLKPGEEVVAEDLLYALLLRSANDAAYTVAVNIAGSQSKFAQLMNERAKKLGCTGTNFVNPHGLHDRNHYSTAQDLVLIAREAMKNETFAKVAGSKFRFIDRSMNEEDTFLRSHNSFLKNRADATGIKTGWTIPAGRCFVGSAERDGLSVITVVLKSTSWDADSNVLADWAFANWEMGTVIAPDQVLLNAPVKEGERLNVPLAAAEPLRMLHERGADDLSYKVVRTNVTATAPLRRGDVLGTVTVVDQDGTEHAIPVYAAQDVLVAKFSLGGDALAPTFILIVGVLMGAAWFVRRRVAR
ncbi:MAG: D-alanyl-D-alanine carboxypeptidase family protein [Fimbriimonadaceae bacterium]